MYKSLKIRIKNILTYENETYEFRDGQAILVVGDNRDDPSQKGNGSGKSGLNEAIAIALTGSPIRNVKNKQVVRRGCDSGEIEYDLYNAMYRCELKIIRRLYSGTKSAGVELYIDGEQTVLADVNEYNKEIFTLLGISKEDFFDFYLITKEYYKPFLAVGDTIKKGIINRFSGAHKVDKALPAVEEDVDAWDRKITAIDKEVSKILGKQEVIADQIKQEEEKFSSENIVKRQLELDEQIEGEQIMLDADQGFLDDTHQKIAAQAAQLEIESVDHSELKKEYMVAIMETQDEIKQQDEYLRKVRIKILEITTAISALDNELAGVIQCPNCEHEFSLQNVTFDVKDAHEQKAKHEKSLLSWKNTLETKLKEIKEYETAISDAKKELDDLVKEEDDARKKKSVVNIEISKLQLSEQKINKAITSRLEKIKEWRAEKEQVALAKSNKLDELSNILMQYIDDETEMRENLQKAIDDRAAIQVWETHFKGFKSYLANKSIKNIEDYTNMYLQMMGTNLSIKIDGYKVLASKKIKEEITCMVYRNGFEEDSYSTFSAGERGRIDICVILAIQTLINLNSPKNGLDLLILDEIMDSVDSLGLECIMKALSGVGKTVMIVSQNEISTLAHQTITIRKQKGVSRIV